MVWNTLANQSAPNLHFLTLLGYALVYSSLPRDYGDYSFDL